MNNADLIKKLFELKDLKYKEFHAKLMPTIDKEKLLKYTEKWIKDKHPYTVRYGIEMLMVYFLGENFSPKYALR